METPVFRQKKSRWVCFSFVPTFCLALAALSHTSPAFRREFWPFSGQWKYWHTFQDGRTLLVEDMGTPGRWQPLWPCRFGPPITPCFPWCPGWIIATRAVPCHTWSISWNSLLSLRILHFVLSILIKIDDSTNTSRRRNGNTVNTATVTATTPGIYIPNICSWFPRLSRLQRLFVSKPLFMSVALGWNAGAVCASNLMQLWQWSITGPVIIVLEYT